IQTGSARPTPSPTIRRTSGTGSRACGARRRWCSRSTTRRKTAARAGPRIPPSTIRRHRRTHARARASKSARWRFSETNLALRELEAAARFGLAVFLAFDHPRVAGDEAAALEHSAQLRLVPDQRLGQTMAHRAGLARKAAARNGANHIVLTLAVCGDQRLLDQHAQHRPGKISFHRPSIDDDLAGAHLDPNASNRVLAFAGGIGAALLVELLHVDGCLRRRRRLERRQLFERLYRLGHYALLLFLRFMAAMSIFSGCCASCGCSALG